MRALYAIVVAGCWTAAPTPAQAPAPRQGELVITDDRFGPLDASSPGTLAYIRQHFPDLDVQPVNDNGLEYRAYAGSDELFFVVTDDDLSIRFVHATSPRVESRAHGWRVGEPFHDSRLISRCECWGQSPTCYHRGDHVAVSFDMTCNFAADTRDFRALDGRAPQRVIWSPTPFGNRDIDGVDDPRKDATGDDDDDDGF
jgi:hypothetical protein